MEYTKEGPIRFMAQQAMSQKKADWGDEALKFEMRDASWPYLLVVWAKVRCLVFWDIEVTKACTL